MNFEPVDGFDQTCIKTFLEGDALIRFGDLDFIFKVTAAL